MNMRLCGENEYSIAITRDEAKQSCMRVSEWANISAPYQAYWLSSSTLSSTVKVKQSSSDTSTSCSDRTNHNFLSDIANTLPDMFAAMKKVVQVNLAISYWKLQSNARICGFPKSRVQYSNC